MLRRVQCCISLCLIFTISSSVSKLKPKYEPTWDSLDARPFPTWYDEAKVGIFMHWGVYSVPSFGSEWFWLNWHGNSSGYVEFMKKNYPPNFTYQDFAPQFTTEFFDPNKWAELIKSSGAKYVVLTSKHHEGYTMWPSKYSYSWNSMDVGPKRDLVGELCEAISKQPDLTFGLYHSLLEWFHPMYISDKNSLFQNREFSVNKAIPEMKELIEKYKPLVLWSDGDWEASDEYWQSKEFLAWLYNESPVKDSIVTNDRWGMGIPCHHGGYYTCTDKYNPGVLQPRKWESCMSVDQSSWGYRRNARIQDYMTIEELVKELVTVVSCGGNLLLNIGPTKEGTIAPIFQERLLQMGEWLKYNGEAIYKSKPWTYQNDTFTSGVWYTKKDNNVYAMSLQWPQDNVLTLASASELFQKSTVVNMLGEETAQALQWIIFDKFVNITLPDKAKIPVNWAWTLKIQNKN